MAVSNSVGKSKLKYNDIRDLILNEEVHRRDAGTNNAQDQALVMENRGRNRGRGFDDRAKSNDRSQSKGRSQFKEMRECFHCGKKGHIKRNCWHWNKEQTEEKDEKNDDEKNTVAVVFHEDVLMLSLEEQKFMLLRMMLSGLLIQQLPTMLSPQKVCSPHTKQATLVL